MSGEGDALVIDVGPGYGEHLGRGEKKVDIIIKSVRDWEETAWLMASGWPVALHSDGTEFPAEVIHVDEILHGLTVRA